MTVAEPKRDFELTTDTTYLALTGELWGVCYKDIRENWPRYNGYALYIISQHCWNLKSSSRKKGTCLFNTMVADALVCKDPGWGISSQDT